jgi:hypothetical protein
MGEDVRCLLIATSRAFIPPWNPIIDETGLLSDLTPVPN